jgi:hypothetical protein
VVVTLTTGRLILSVTNIVISHREYHSSSCQCYYHRIDTSPGRLLVRESIIRPVVSVTITGSTPLLVDYISHREYQPSSCQCYYHWINTSAGGLLVTESLIRPVVSVTITEDPVIETLTTGRMILSVTNSPPAEVSIQ